MTDQELREALDLLDQLIDPLLPLGPSQGVLQGRIQGWKAMMRAQLKPPTTSDVPPSMDGQPPYRGGP